jgi:F-type H+-transporting ATPase subunit b
MRKLFAGAGVATAALIISAGGAAAAEGEEHKFPDHASEECFEILEAGGGLDDCQESPSPILPETNEIIWGTSAFAVLFAVFVWKGFPAVKQATETRQDRIRGDLEAAERAKTDAEGVLADYRAQLADARTEANRVIDEARQSAESVRRDLIARAEQEAADVRSRADDDIRVASDRAFADLRSQVASLSVELAEKIVERNLDVATQQQLIDSYITSVGRN